MRAETKQLHDEVEVLGRALGFEVGREVGDSVLSLRLDDAYQPRVDLMWSLALTGEQASAIAGVVGSAAGRIQHLPVVGIEVEGSGPSTKTLAADVINMISLGTRLGLLVVVDGQDRMYRRAVRIVRTMRRSFGDLGIVPLEAESLAALSARTWDVAASDSRAIRNRLPAGGEGSLWLPATRHRLKQIGEAAGFLVAEPYVPPILEVAWKHHDRSELEAMANPATGARYRMRRWDQFFTGSQIDMAWLLPLPRGVPTFLSAVLQGDDTLGRDEFIYPELYDHVAVVGFEFESASGKHAGGGLANLGAYATVGVAVAPTTLGATEIQRTLNRYQPTLGLRNVIVRSADELFQD